MLQDNPHVITSFSHQVCYKSPRLFRSIHQAATALQLAPMENETEDEKALSLSEKHQSASTHFHRIIFLSDDSNVCRLLFPIIYRCPF